jgi:hypothetical protein
MTSDVDDQARISRAEASRLREERFYANTIDEAERLVYDTARGMPGLDEEIAMLRTALRGFRDGKPPADKDGETKDSFMPLLQGLDVLRKMVAVRYRMSGAAERQLDANLAGLIQGIFDEFKSGASDE